MPLPALRGALLGRDFNVPRFLWESLYNTAYVVVLPLILWRHGVLGTTKRAFLPPRGGGCLMFIFAVQLMTWLMTVGVNVLWALDGSARAAVSFGEVLLLDAMLLMRGMSAGTAAASHSLRIMCGSAAICTHRLET